LESIVKGRVIWKFGDNFNSDAITEYPKYKDVSDEEGLKKICMAGFDPEFPAKVKKGDLMVGGRNFGFGHPHVQAHQALKAAGISAMVADSFSRGWFRTAISTGFPVLPCKGISGNVNIGETLEIDLRTGQVKNTSSGKIMKTDPLPEFILRRLDAGGTVPYLRMRFQKKSQ